MEDTSASRSLSELSRRWAPAAILIVIVVGTVWVTFSPDPEHTQAAHSFQTARRGDDWEQVGEIMADEFQLRGGELEDLPGYLDPRITYSEFLFPVPSARVVLARVSERLAVAETDWDRQVLCLWGNDEEGWRVAPTPFLLHYLERDSFLERPGDIFSPAAAMISLPRIPPPGTGQARVLADPVWVRTTPEGRLRTLVMLRIVGQNLELSLHSVLAAAQWSDDRGGSGVPARLLWTDLAPSADGVWPLSAGSWWLDLEWGEIPAGEFSLVLGTFVSGEESRTLTMTGIPSPRD